MNFKLVRWLLGIPNPPNYSVQLGVMVRCWPDDEYELSTTVDPPPTDEEIVLDAVYRVSRHINATQIHAH